MNLIVNADDFGRSRSRNLAIDECFKKNYISQASLMVNMGSETKEAILLAERGNYKNKLVLHLNLTLGTPLTERILNTCVCKDGRFKEKSNWKQTLRILFSIKTRLAIKEECEKQIKEFINFGITPYHLDSHNWIHLEIPIWIQIKPLLKQYGFQSVRPLRKGLRTFPGFKNFNKYKWEQLISALYYRLSDWILKRSGLTRNEYSSNLEEFLSSNCCENIYEIFCHPDIVDDKIMDLSWSYKGNDYISMSEFDSKLIKYDNRYTYHSYFFSKDD